MSKNDPITFTRLADGTLLQRVQTDAGAEYKAVRDQSDLGRIAALSDDEVEAMSRSDMDHPALDEEFWTQIEAPPRKEAISIKLDEDVLKFFREDGPGYQTRINAVLRRYMRALRKAG